MIVFDILVPQFLEDTDVTKSFEEVGRKTVVQGAGTNRVDSITNLVQQLLRAGCSSMDWLLRLTKKDFRWIMSSSSDCTTCRLPMAISGAVTEIRNKLTSWLCCAEPTNPHSVLGPG